MIKKFTLLLFLICITLFAAAQSIGDTITVQSFDYNSSTRDTMVSFPTNTSIKYEKILMLYNMRCKNGLVSSGSQRNLGCGEWDYSCNTYLHDSTRFDSTIATIPNYTISNFSGTSFNYSATPLYDIYRKIEKKTTITTTVSEDIDTLGTGTISSNKVFPTQYNTGKSQFIYTASELIAAGVLAGNIDALILDINSVGTRANQLKIKIKPTTKTILKADSIDLTGFTDVFYSTTNFVSGLNRFQFHTPFVWDGISNIIVEYSFNGNLTGTNSSVNCDNYSNGGLSVGGDHSLIFDNSNYIESNSYKGVGGSTNRTMEAWVKTTKIGAEILSWGANATGQKWNWRTTTNGYQRIEINGNGVVGGTNIADGNWHHVTAVLNGNNLSAVQFYVDGVLDPKTANPTTAINTNATSGINVQVSKGIHNRYLVGEMDGLRIWNTNLSLTTINDWKKRKINASHPNYSNLEMNYELNNIGSAVVSDSSNLGINGTISGSQNRHSFNGQDLFKELHELDVRPNLHLVQGVYVLSTVNDTIFDSIAHGNHLVQQNQVFPKTGEKRNDSTGVISSNIYYNSDIKTYYYDELGNIYDSIINTPDGTITLSNLEYQRRFPTKFEIMSFVTPYGINLDLGINGKTWVFDVTDFSPFLTGNKRITMERGGQWQEEMDISFQFIVGTPEREVLDIQEIWPVSYPNYTDIISEKVFPPRKIPLLDSGKYFEVTTSITGHGQEGEFIPRNHFFKVGASKQFQWQVWTDCGENPVYPQGGTWIYDRAGWCPGMPTDIRRNSVTDYVTAGDSGLFDYGITTATGTSRYIVSNKLITYGEYNHNLDAAIVDIVSPSKRVEYQRENDICHYPKITIRNAGKDTLRFLKIEFWVNNNSTKETFNWTGKLAPSTQEVVEMFAPASMWNSISGPDNIFNVEISNPNNGIDEYSYNNKYSTEFKVPIVVPSSFVLHYRSNSAANETSFKIYDEFGNVIHTNSGQANNTLVSKTFNLGLGCYRLEVTDTDGDGIGFWANSDGAGYMRLQRNPGPVIYNVQPDFGASFTLDFTVGSPLAIANQTALNTVKLYPNPTSGSFTIEGNELENVKVTLINSLGQEINIETQYGQNQIKITNYDLASGIYSVIIQNGEAKTIKKLIVQ